MVRLCRSAAAAAAHGLVRASRLLHDLWSFDADPEHTRSCHLMLFKVLIWAYHVIRSRQDVRLYPQPSAPSLFTLERTQKAPSKGVLNTNTDGRK